MTKSIVRLLEEIKELLIQIEKNTHKRESKELEKELIRLKEKRQKN